MSRLTRRRATVLLPASLLASLLVVACSGGDGDSSSSDAGSGGSVERATVATAQRPARAAGQGASQMSIAASSALFTSSPAAVLLASSDAGDVALASSTGVALGIPVLASGPGLTKEIERLGATSFVTYGDAEGGWDQFTESDARLAGPQDVAEFAEMLGVDAEASSVSEKGLLAKVTALDARADPVVLTQSSNATPPSSGTSPASPSAADSGELPQFKQPQDRSPALVLADSSDDKSVPAIATARAAGAEVMPIDITDPRAAESAAAVKKAKDVTILALGSGFEPSDTFAQNVTMAQTAPELPGGGQLALPGKFYVALYGNVITADLGLLGEQDTDASIKRAKEYAEKYEDLTDVPVIPTFEIIVTVASGSAGADGSYSSKGDVADIEPWVRRAQEEGVYVVLDLQSGREDSLAQAKMYEQLLTYPHVGLAVDPEWRLEPHEQPLQQIGHIDAEEINRTQDWLADLVKKNDLPQKIFILHQFKSSSLPDRSQINFSARPEVATLLHADGQGNQAQKQDTWRALKQDLSQAAFLGWKNFTDEDQPMLTPTETMRQVNPTPNFISYQ